MMYRVEVTRTESEEFYVEAENKEEAEQRVHDMVLLDWDASAFDEFVMAVPVYVVPEGKKVYRADD